MMPWETRLGSVHLSAMSADAALAEYAQLEHLAPDHIATIANHATILEVAGRAREAACAVARAARTRAWLRCHPDSRSADGARCRARVQSTRRMRRVVDESSEPSVAMCRNFGTALTTLMSLRKPRALTGGLIDCVVEQFALSPHPIKCSLSCGDGKRGCARGASPHCATGCVGLATG